MADYSNHPVIQALITKTRPTPGENQMVCPVCDGLGMVYQAGYVGSCYTCGGTGLAKICPHCKKQYIHQCNCDAAHKERWDKREAKDLVDWLKHPAINLADWSGPVVRGDKFYSEPEYALEDLEPSDTPDEMRFYGCNVVKISLSAEDILHNLCENIPLDEDCTERVMTDADSLQEVLDKWCADHPNEYWEPDYTKPLTFTPEQARGEESTNAY